VASKPSPGFISATLSALMCFEVRLPVHEGLGLPGVDVEAHDRKARTPKGLGERQTDVAEPDDAHNGTAALDAIHQWLHPDDSFFAPPAALALATRCP